jgi:hypothetical protein
VGTETVRAAGEAAHVASLTRHLSGRWHFSRYNRSALQRPEITPAEGGAGSFDSGSRNYEIVLRLPNMEPGECHRCLNLFGWQFAFKKHLSGGPNSSL